MIGAAEVLGGAGLEIKKPAAVGQPVMGSK